MKPDEPNRREQALMLGGMVGGPVSIFLYTPLRNSITIGAESKLPALQLYRKCLKPRLTMGWTGALTPTFMSAPQFVAMGPLYHTFSGFIGPALAIIPTAFSESCISFGSQCRNAQLAYNAIHPGTRLALQHPLNPIHPAFAFHVTRNCLAISGIRVLSPLSTRMVETINLGGHRLNGPVAGFIADFLASIVAAAMSMPANQLFNYFAITPEAKGPKEAIQFLRSQYFVRNEMGRYRISGLMVRDIGMRCAYIAPQLTTFVSIERLFLYLAEN